MKFTANCSKLLSVLTLLKGAVETKATIPILSHVLIRAEGGQLELRASDLDVTLPAQCPATITDGGTAAVPLARLLGLLSSLPPEDTVSASLSDNKWLVLSSGGSRSRIPGMAADSFPAKVEPLPPMVEINAAKLGRMIDRVSIAVPHMASQYFCAGALLVVTAGEAAFVATDGHRLALATCDCGAGDFRQAVPWKAMLELRSLCEVNKDGLVGASHDENHIFFRLGDKRMSARKLAQDFVDYARVLPGPDIPAALIVADSLSAALTRVAQFVEDETHGFHFDLAQGEVHLRTASQALGENEERVAVDGYLGDKIETAFNAHYILDFLRAAKAERVIFAQRNSKASGELRPAGDSTYRYIIMPIYRPGV